MKWYVIERQEDGATYVWEYDNEEAAIDNIKHMLIPEIQEYVPKREIKLIKGEEIDISNVEGYSLDEISNRKG